MNQIYFLINIFFLLYSNIFKFNNCKLVNEVVDYSYLLPKVRIDLVNKALKVLPGKGFVDILKMCNSMAKLKGTYEMNDIEGAFLLYQWIIKNINIICKPKKDEESSIKVYKSGEGNAYEISTLYKTMSYYLNITSGLIRGYIRNFDNRTYLPVEPYDWVWNYILINNTYYLVDVSFGKGGCFGNNERYYDNIFFLGQNLSFSLVQIIQLIINGNYLMNLFLLKNLKIIQLKIILFMNLDIHLYLPKIILWKVAKKK